MTVLRIRRPEEYRLYLGDCLQEMSRIEDQSVDAVIADPPYGTTANKWDSVISFSALWEEYRRVLKSTGVVVIFSAQPFTSLLIVSNLAWFKYELIWLKSNTTGHLNSRKMPLRKHENLVIFSPAKLGTSTYNPEMTKGVMQKKNSNAPSKQSTYGAANNSKAYHNDLYYPTSVIAIGGTVKNQYKGFHPSEKPVDLLENLVKQYSNKGETILDSTMGSGTTGVACMNTGRRFIGIENDSKYFEIAKQRIAEAAEAAKENS